MVATTDSTKSTGITASDTEHITRSLQHIEAELKDLKRESKRQSKRSDASQDEQRLHLWTCVNAGAFCALLLAKGVLVVADNVAKGQGFFGYNQGHQLSMAPLNKGDKIGPYEISSGFGARESPGGVGSTNHQGVDVPLEEGTDLRVPVDSNVECDQQEAGGNFARIVPPQQTGVKHQFMAAHLSSCKPGFYLRGQVFGKSGNTGHSTGPHLHWAQKPIEGGDYIQPTRGYLERVLGVESKSSGDEIARLREAIVGQESGGNHSLQNASGSGAMGLGQVMPENLASWSKAALGREVSQQEFLSNPDLQIQVIDHKLSEYWQQSLEQANGNQEEAVQRVAAWWYSGQPDKFNDSTPQRWGNDSYPSIAQYAQEVLEKWKSVTTTSVSGSSDSTPTVVGIYAGSEFGSGVSIGNGRVVTNAHVINGQSTVNFKLDGRLIKDAKVIKVDPSADLALIQTSEKLPATTIAQALPQPGDRVTAIGNPLNKLGTKTDGLVLAVGGMIKHSAQLQHGSSGGALLNSQGQLVGINTRCVSSGNACSQTGFAITSTKVQEFIK